MNGFRVKNGVELTSYTGSLSVKTLNRVAVLRALLLGGSASRLEIAVKTGLSSATVSRVVNALIDEGLVEEVGASLTGSRGCPPIILQFRGNVAYVIGVDIGECFIRFELINLLGESIDVYETTTDALVGGDTTFKRVVSGFKQLLFQNNLTEKDIWCTCVCIPGIVDEEGCVNVPDIEGWWHYPLYSKLCDVLKTKIILEKAVNCAVLGEYMYGCAKNANNVVFLKISAGIGAGIIINGKVLLGNNSAAGELGFMLPYPDNNPSHTKKRGVLESIVGVRAIMDALGESKYIEPIDEHNIPFVQAICQEAVNDDNAESMEVIAKNIKFYAQTAINIAAIINPEIIIIGGDVCPLGDYVIDGINSYMQEFLPYPAEVRMTELGINAPLKGAARIALESSLVRFGIVSPDEVAGNY